MQVIPSPHGYISVYNFVSALLAYDKAAQNVYGGKIPVCVLYF